MRDRKLSARSRGGGSVKHHKVILSERERERERTYVR